MHVVTIDNSILKVMGKKLIMSLHVVTINDIYILKVIGKQS